MNISEGLERFSDATAQGAALRLPLVSVVVVNFNYGRYLEQAVSSVYGQSYPHVECVVVDNASTDDSAEVLAALSLRYPKLAVLRRAANDGQTAASLDGLAATSGPYVVFLDADDFLLPRAIDLHILTHLSARRHIGFTSGDMLQVQNGEVVLSTGSAFNLHLGARKRPAPAPAPVRPYRHPGGAWPDQALAALLDGRLDYVPPLRNRWIWSPTSGMCFRRDALTLFADSPDLPSLRANTDLYFAIGIGGLCGSMLIDEPVFGYRIHGGNVFSRGPQLENFSVYQTSGGNNYNDRAKRMLVDHLVANIARFAPAADQRVTYFRLLKCLDIQDDAPGLPRWARNSRAATALVRHFPAVAEIVGPTLTRLVMMFVFSVPPWVALRCKG